VVIFVSQIDDIQNYKIVIATLFRHFEWGKYQKFPLRYVDFDLLICETLSLGRVEGKAYKNTPNKYNITYTTQHRTKTNTYTWLKLHR